jgi:branched-subunit amino acid aminotransferase/4-amino-4-deoxychorismate lyase
MPIPISVLTPQGVTAAPYTADSMAEAATKEPQGVYTVARTFERDKALLLDDHLDRLERSAQLEGIAVKLDRAALRAALRALVDQSGYAESRFRITIPRTAPDQQIISLEPYKPVPDEIIKQGARIVTLHMERHNPVAKTTKWATERKETVESFPPGIYEGVLVSPEGLLLECTSSNFYAVLDNVLWTADDKLVLGGIARQIVFTVAPRILPIRLKPIHVEQIDKISEAFLTSSGRGVVPIVEIGGKTIGDGKLGRFSRSIRHDYEAWAAAHLESI